jgi:tetratricopeptide (TPR) repeat protein
MTLAEITSGTGDLPGAIEHLALARDLCAASGDVDGQVAATVSWARLAYLAADGDRAEALYDEAERLVTGDPRRLMACLVGRAAVAVLRGRPRDAVELVDRARALLGPAATPLELVAVNQVRGSAFEALGEYAAADSCYGEASALCEAAGLWHMALGMAWWRADALVRRAAAATGDERREIARRALDLALPAALASEAVRQRFPHGPLRERWVALASAPATRTAFWAIGAVEDPALAAEYIDHIAGAVSLHAEGVTPVERGELVSLPEPPLAEPRLPYAASGFTAGEDPTFPVAGFELPPRVRLDPAVPSRLDAWIDVAEERYGFPVRSALAVASW